MTINTNTTSVEDEQAGRHLWAELQMTRLFSPLPMNWDEVEAIVPFLTRDHAERFIEGEDTNFTRRTLFIELFRWHPGLALTLPGMSHDNAIALGNQLLDQYGGIDGAMQVQPALINDLAAAFMNRGNARQAQDDFVGAVADYDQAIKLQETLLALFGGVDVAATTQPKVISDSAAAFMNRGNTRQAQDDFVGAVADYDQAIKLQETLLALFGGLDVTATTQPKVIHDSAKVHLHKADALHKQFAYEAAVKCYSQAIDLWERLQAAVGGATVVVQSLLPSLANDLTKAQLNRAATLALFTAMQTALVFRFPSAPTAAGATTLTAAASPACADETSGDKSLPDEVWLTIDDGLKLRIARHMRTGWMTLQLVGRTVTETATVWVDERQIELVERFSPDGFAVVKAEDVVPVLRGTAALKIKFR